MNVFDISKESILVIGSDSRIGSALLKKYRKSGNLVYGTTRRAIDNDNHIYSLDLSDKYVDYEKLPVTSTVFLCAYITSMSQCDSDINSSAINVDGIVRLATHYLSKGSLVVFLSSNAVFNNNQIIPDELEVPEPKSSYGRQKFAAEQKLLKIATSSPGDLVIVRMTKVLSSDLPLLRDWADAANKGEVINPFSDVKICPISLNFVISSLKRIASMRDSGVFHLSGEIEISYLDLAKKTLEICGFSSIKLSGEKKGVADNCISDGGKLNMKFTKKSCDISPEKFSSIVDNVLLQLKQ
jgi:dTDP-4-dehydrorhamnose reductase